MLSRAGQHTVQWPGCTGIDSIQPGLPRRTGFVPEVIVVDSGGTAPPFHRFPLFRFVCTHTPEGRRTHSHHIGRIILTSPDHMCHFGPYPCH